MKKSPKKNLIYLRGHHFLCLQGYQGYGYDKKFKENMDKIFHQLDIKNIINNLCNNNNNTNTEIIDKTKNIKEYNIILTDYPDDLCIYCPKLKENKCTGELVDLTRTKENTEKIKDNNDRIIRMDQIVLKKAKLKKNIEYSIEDVILAVNDVFSTLKTAKKVCKNCKWENKCLWFQSRDAE